MRRAAEVLQPWVERADGDLLGEWTVQPEGEQWRLCSPAQLQPLLAGWGILDLLPSVELVVRAVEFQATALAILHAPSPLGMHGALLAKGGSAVAIVGGKEAGKSTLSAALWQFGLDLLSDDGFFLEGEGLIAHPVPRRSRLRGTSRELFPDTFWTQLASQSTSFADQDGSLLFHPQERSLAATLHAVVLLSAEPGPVERLSSADALVDLVRHTYRFVVSGAPATLRQLQPLTEQIACYRMGRSDLAEQCRRIESLLA